MILTASEILKRLDKDIIITPFNVKHLAVNSVDLTLDKTLKVYTTPVLDFKKANTTMDMVIPEDGLVLQPGRVYLGQTVEYTETNNLVPVLYGKSSTGRLGLFVHVTAGFGDIGYKGTWTLELVATQPVKVYPNMKVCQIIYHTIEGSSLKKYKGKYQGAREVIASKSFEDFNSDTDKK